jgi:hypothetical protein
MSRSFPPPWFDYFCISPTPCCRYEAVAVLSLHGPAWLPSCREHETWISWNSLRVIELLRAVQGNSLVYSKQKRCYTGNTWNWNSYSVLGNFKGRSYVRVAQAAACDRNAAYMMTRSGFNTDLGLRHFLILLECVDEWTKIHSADVEMLHVANGRTDKQKRISKLTVRFFNFVGTNPIVVYDWFKTTFRLPQPFGGRVGLRTGLDRQALPLPGTEPRSSVFRSYTDWTTTQVT